MYFAFWWLSRFGFEVLRKLCVNHSPLNAAHHILMRFEPGPRKLFAKLFDILFDKLFEMNFLAICLLWHIFYLGPNPVRSKSKWQSKEPLNQLSEFKHDASNRFLHAKTWIARHGEKNMVFHYGPLWAFLLRHSYGFCTGFHSVPMGFLQVFAVFLRVSYGFFLTSNPLFFDKCGSGTIMGILYCIPMHRTISAHFCKGGTIWMAHLFLPILHWNCEPPFQLTWELYNPSQSLGICKLILSQHANGFRSCSG